MPMFDVIKYEGDGRTLVHKYPHEDFNTKSQLVVQQAQEAIFFSRGAMADHFTVPGTYTLETKNIPILCHLVNLPFGKESPFHATVYFIDKTERLNKNWGIGRIPFIPKEYAIKLLLGFHGKCSFKIGDAETFINKVLGTLAEYNDDQILDFTKAFITSHATAYLTKFFKENDLDLLTLEEYLVDLSEMLLSLLAPDFAEYGIELTKFIIEEIAQPEHTTEYQRFFEFRTQNLALTDIKNQGERAAAETREKMRVFAIEETTRQDLEKRRLITEAEGKATARKTEGYTYATERAFDVAEATANNEGAGSFSAAGMGLGMGLGAGSAAGAVVGGLYQDALSQIGGAFPSQSPAQPQQPSFGADLGFGGNVGLGGSVGLGGGSEAPLGASAGTGSKFCENCGASLNADALFCDNCGAPQATQNKCRRCGHVFERPGNFCPKCGEKRN